MTRDVWLAKLTALNHALRRQGVEPVFTDEVVATLSHRGLKAAVKITEKELVSSTRKLAEQ